MGANQDPILDRLFPDIREDPLASSDKPVFGRYDLSHRMHEDSFLRNVYFGLAAIGAVRR